MSEFDFELGPDEPELNVPGFEDDEDFSGTLMDGLEDELADVLDLGRVWRNDTSLLDSHSAMNAVVENVVETVAMLKKFEDYGVPADLLKSEITLTSGTGSMIIASLQLLGFFAPELRPDVEALLNYLMSSRHAPTEADKEVLQEAGQRINDDIVAKLRAAATEELTRLAEASEQDAGLN